MDSKLYLCLGVELDPNYKYTLNFETEAEQLQYFSTKTQSIIDVDGYSYIREEEAVKVDANIDDLFGINYLIYKNKGKEYYAFITHKEYVSESTTKIYFEIDVLQTFMWDYTIDESFIEREHQDRYNKETKDPIFNIEKENIDYGEDYTTKSTTIGNNENLVYTYIYLKKDKNDSGVTFSDNNIDTGYEILMTVSEYKKEREETYRPIHFVDGESEYVLLEQAVAIREYRNNPLVTQIIVSRIPPVDFLIDDLSSQSVRKISMAHNDAVFLPVYNETYKANMLTISSRNITDMSNLPYNSTRFSFDFEINTDINSHPSMKSEPKLYIYPYNFDKIQYGGNELIKKNEHSIVLNFVLYQSLASEGSSALIPLDYLQPHITWTDDKYSQHTIVNQMPNYVNIASNEWNQYILQNKASRMSGFVNDGISVGLSSLGALGALATGHPLAAGASLLSVGLSGYTKISSQLAKEKDIKNQPDDIKQFNGDLSLNIVLRDMLPIQTHFDILPKFKEKLFKFFMHYGYACNSFKKPNINSRYYYNYIKCIDVNIKSEIDSVYKDKLVDIFDNGITVWHYRQGNYRGVNNYDYENVEMSLMEVQNV